MIRHCTLLLRLSLTVSTVLLFACTAPRKAAAPDNMPVRASAGTAQSTVVPREFRAAWIATVANINWPSKPGLPVDSQKAEALRLLDYLSQHRFNAAVLQVRPQADALYEGKIEPWSYYLTGEQGKAPSPYYDPLRFWIDEAHRRGIELHVWLNPYRAHHKAGGPVSNGSIVKQRPELVHYLKEGYWWMDPALQATQDRTSAVIADLVKRYDLDGVHFDDYFYPYPSYNLNEDFPDSAAYAVYQSGGGRLGRGDWRRDAVNKLIKRLYGEIKAQKPWVKFGLSPFGIWRPGHPASVEGFDQYDKLYADARLWLNEGWIDYFTPQLYWKITREAQSFPALLKWWSDENTRGRHLWPGIAVGADTARTTVEETLNQIMIARGLLPGSAGVVHWSIGQVMRNEKLGEALRTGLYRREALVPPSPWLGAAPSGPQGLTQQKMGDSLRLGWSHPNAAGISRWVVYFKKGGKQEYTLLPASARSYTLSAGDATDVQLSAVDRNGMESPTAALANFQ